MSPAVEEERVGRAVAMRQQVSCWPVEVGCRGFAGQSLCKAFTALSIVGKRRRRAIASTTDTAESTSRCLWMKKEDPWVAARA